MSDQYTVGVVTVTPRAGGYYDLSHESLPAPITVRGLEKANAEAETLSRSIVAGLPVQFLDSEDGNEIAAPVMAQAQVQSAEDELTALMARVAELQAQGVTVAVPNPDAAAVDAHNARMAIPNALRGTMSEEKLDALAAVGQRMVRIILDDNPDIPPTGLFLAHNGRSYMVRTGVEVDVPDFIVSVLDDAKASQAVTDPETNQVIGYRTRLRHPYRKV